METLKCYRKERNDKCFWKNIFEQMDYYIEHCKKNNIKIKAVAYCRVWTKEQLNTK